MLESQSWAQGWVVEFSSYILLRYLLIWSWSICSHLYG
jgi:hypothetical protein